MNILKKTFLIYLKLTNEILINLNYDFTNFYISCQTTNNLLQKILILCYNKLHL